MKLRRSPRKRSDPPRIDTASGRPGQPDRDKAAGGMQRRSRVGSTCVAATAVSQPAAFRDGPLAQCACPGLPCQRVRDQQPRRLHMRSFAYSRMTPRLSHHFMHRALGVGRPWARSSGALVLAVSMAGDLNGRYSKLARCKRTGGIDPADVNSWSAGPRRVSQHGGNAWVNDLASPLFLSLDGAGHAL